MADPATNTTAATGGEPITQAPRSVAPARCLRCAADLSRLSAAGRYCPHCGLDTYGSPPAALYTRARESTLSATSAQTEWRHLGELSSDGQPVSTPVPIAGLPAPESSSQILRGYANALYGLGRRYELGAGPARNGREAVRCYLKAARLGNFMAFARLASRWLEGHDSAPAPASNDAPDHANDPVQ